MRRREPDIEIVRIKNEGCPQLPHFNKFKKHAILSKIKETL
jgi:hypothetical protein